MDIDFKKLRHLVTVARLGSFSRAAEQLHISQPALSRSVALAEEQLGIQVFDRSVHGASLTRLGKLAVEEAEGLLEQARIFDHNLRLCREGASGKVAFGMWPLIASLVLPDLSTHFISQRPQLKIRASVKTGDTLMQELREDRIELFFCGQGQVDTTPDLQVETIGEIVLSVLVRAGHPFTAVTAINPLDINRYPLLISVELGQVPGEYRENGLFICDNAEVMRHTVQHTDSIWLAPRQLVCDELAAGTLKEVQVINPTGPAGIDICMVSRRGYDLSPAGREIAAFVKMFFLNLEQD